MAACKDCRTTTNVAAFGLCEPCNIRRGEVERAEQGLPSEITDPAVRLRLAEILGLVDPTSAGHQAA
jgi:hypothetical protein